MSDQDTSWQRTFNEQVNKKAEQLGLKPGKLDTLQCLGLLVHIVRLSEGRLKQLPDNVWDNAEMCTDLEEKLNEAWRKRDYASIFDIDILKPRVIPRTLDRPLDERTAIEISWNTRFVGNAASALLSHIQHFHFLQSVTQLPSSEGEKEPTTSKGKGPAASKGKKSTLPDGKTYYANYTAIVQSSGMGKSRVVDELSKSELVIPMVLQDVDFQGFPPGDPQVFSFLSRRNATEFDTFNRACAFLHAVFMEMTSILKGGNNLTDHPIDKDLPLAGQFRHAMTHEMKFGVQGPHRQRFYDRVITKAKSLVHSYSEQNENWLQQTGNEQVTTRATPFDEHMRHPDYLLKVAFNDLYGVVKTFPRSRTAQSTPPIVIISLDEVHRLMPQGDGPSKFIELRRAIRAISDKHVFMLLLSTAGKLYSYIPPPTIDPSRRLQGEGHVYTPFSELGFDQFAKKLKFPSRAGKVTSDMPPDRKKMKTTHPLESTTSDGDNHEMIKLSRISEGDHFYFYGRPLWATRYERGHPNVRNGMISFAAQKLMGGAIIGGSMTDDQQLACIAQRIPIEFLSVTYNANPQTALVQNHMRVVTRVDGNLETMLTLSPSEPILSEAAYMLMWAMDPARALEHILSGFSVHAGDRGELLAMLLLTIARDRAIGPCDEHGEPMGGQRWCTLKDFLSELFAENHFKNIWNALNADKFSDSKVYFSHFAKNHEQKLVHVECLMRMMVRGAAILCATSQPGVDLILPFLTSGDDITPSKIGVILIQVKNDLKYTATYPGKDGVFDAMKLAPYHLSPDVPVIRFVFALAAKTSIVEYRPRQQRPYDFWVAGLNDEVFKAVAHEGDNVWRALLNASYGWKTIYKSTVPEVGKLRRLMCPGAVEDVDHWNRWCVNPPEIGPESENDEEEG